MKILFVRTYCPNPIFYGSEMRASRFVDFLRTQGEVDLLTLTKPTSEFADMAYIQRHFKNHYYFDQKVGHQRLSNLEKIRHLAPWQIISHYSKDFQKQVNSIVEENQYDLIFIFKLEPVFFFLQLPSHWHKKVIIDFDDILSELYKNFYSDQPITAFKNSYSLKLYEQKALKQFKQVLVCSQDAVNKISRPLRHKVSIVPNVFETNKDRFFPIPEGEGRFLFVGSLDYFPNIQGLCWFFENIWPDLKKAFPEKKMSVVGKAQKDSSLLIAQMGSPQDVEICLNVPSVTPYYKDCFVSVVPLLNGSGTRLKILESVAHGRPVISTMKGMEGLDFKDKESIFIFKDQNSFIQAYRSLLEKENYVRTTQNAFKVLENHYSSDVFVAAMQQMWKRTV